MSPWLSSEEWSSLEAYLELTVQDRQRNNDVFYEVAESFAIPIVTAARDTPSARATAAFVIPPSTIAAHRAQRSGPLSRLSTGSSASRCGSRG